MSALRLPETRTRWRVAGEEAPLLVMLHGRASNEEAMFVLVDRLPTHLTIAAVAGPLPASGDGRLWYEPRGAQIAAGGHSEAITRAAQALLSWLDAAAPTRRVALFGFSQGAAVSLQALRLRPDRIDAVIDLAGFVAPDELPGDRLLHTLRPPVFRGRGALDTVVPSALVARTERWLPGHATASVHVYPTLTHAIADEQLRDAGAFLEEWVPA